MTDKKDTSNKSKDSSKHGGEKDSETLIAHDPLAAMSDDQYEEAITEPCTVKLAAVTPIEPAAERPSEAIEEAGTEDAVAGELIIGDSLTIREAEECHQRMLAMIDAAEPVLLDASDTESIDGAGLQLLAVFVREAEEQGRDICWSGASDELRQSAALMGLAKALCLEETEQAA